MIKINLVREGRTVRGAGAAAPSGGPSVAAGGSNLNNILVIAGVFLGVLIGGGWWFLKNNTLKERQETVGNKQAEADRLQAIIKQVDDYTKRKESLQKRIDLINQLKQNQKGPVKIMDRVSQDLPDLVWLDRMSFFSQSPTALTFERPSCVSISASTVSVSWLSATFSRTNVPDALYIVVSPNHWLHVSSGMYTSWL